VMGSSGTSSSKLSSSTSSLKPKSSSIFSASKPVISFKSSSKPLSNSLSLGKSQSPLILFKAMFKARSRSGGKSTIETSVSVSPRSFRIFKRWWPEMSTLPCLFITNGSTKSNSSMDFLSFSYSGSPGFKSFLGLYLAGLISSNGIRLISKMATSFSSLF
jgi:hypothetical protein